MESIMKTQNREDTHCGCSAACEAAMIVPAEPLSERISELPAGALHSVFSVPGMDCPSEERLIRMALDGADGLRRMDFDLPARTLALTHDGPPESLQARLAALGMEATLIDSQPCAATPPVKPDDAGESRVLRVLGSAWPAGSRCAAGWRASAAARRTPGRSRPWPVRPARRR
jgi:hypothetical protein